MNHQGQECVLKVNSESMLKSTKNICTEIKIKYRKNIRQHNWSLKCLNGHSCSIESTSFNQMSGRISL